MLNNDLLDFQHHRRTMAALGVTESARKLLDEMRRNQQQGRFNLAFAEERLGQYLYRTSDQGGLRLERRELSPSGSPHDAGRYETLLDPSAVRRDVASSGLPLGSQVRQSELMLVMTPTNNELRNSWAFQQVCSLRISRDHSLIAYLVPMHRGVDRFCCMVRRAGGQQDEGHLVDILPSVSAAEFSADGRSLLYTTPDEAGRPNKVGGACREGLIPFGREGSNG